MVNCDGCSNEALIGDNFCRQCGSELGDEELLSCDCGAVIGHEDNFCHDCGTEFEGVVEDTDDGLDDDDDIDD